MQSAASKRQYAENDQDHNLFQDQTAQIDAWSFAISAVKVLEGKRSLYLLKQAMILVFGLTATLCGVQDMALSLIHAHVPSTTATAYEGPFRVLLTSLPTNPALIQIGVGRI